MNRRGFLGTILALGAAPAIVRADSLMRIIVPGRPILDVDYINWITKEALANLENNLAFHNSGIITLEDYMQRYPTPVDYQSACEGIEVGSVITIRKPLRYLAT